MHIKRAWIRLSKTTLSACEKSYNTVLSLEMMWQLNHSKELAPKYNFVCLEDLKID